MAATDAHAPLSWSRMTVLPVEGDVGAGRTVDVVELRTGLSQIRGEWRLWVARDPDVQIWALPADWSECRTNGSAPFKAEDLALRYLRQSGGRSLPNDLAALDPTVELPNGLQIYYWRPYPVLADRAGRTVNPALALHAMTREHVRTRTLPSSLAEAGVEIDPLFTRPQSLNDVVRLRANSGARTYVKVEENREGARAELLASLIWYRLKWPGIRERVVMSDDLSVLIIPPVGDADGIEDRGSIRSVFDGYPRERDAVTFDAERAGRIRRLPLEALELADPDDVLRFVTMNAAWGNSDRHMGNLHYGWRRDPVSERGGDGFLLPIDHGRCFFNNQPGGAASRIHGSPAAAVTGRVSNPHQLLRAFVERSQSDTAAARRVITEFTARVAAILGELAGDPEWAGYEPELTSMLKRVMALGDEPQQFIDVCSEVVL